MRISEREASPAEKVQAVALHRQGHVRLTTKDTPAWMCAWLPTQRIRSRLWMPNPDLSYNINLAQTDLDK